MKRRQMWHPLNGKWADLQQITKDGITEYYTNGVMVERREVDEHGQPTGKRLPLNKNKCITPPVKKKRNIFKGWGIMFGLSKD